MSKSWTHTITIHGLAPVGVAIKAHHLARDGIRPIYGFPVGSDAGLQGRQIHVTQDTIEGGRGGNPPVAVGQVLQKLRLVQAGPVSNSPHGGLARQQASTQDAQQKRPVIAPSLAGSRIGTVCKKGHNRVY